MKELCFWVLVGSLALAVFIFLKTDLLPETKPVISNISTETTVQKNIISLPSPLIKGDISLEEVIFKRRSIRDYQSKSLSLDQLSQILWSGQGITDEKTKFRTAPSAGALYPLDIYIAVGDKGVEGLEVGSYHYIPQGHKIEKLAGADFRVAIMKAALEQEFIAQAPVVLVITGGYERTTKKYADRGKQYVHMEAGHVAQNIYLQAVALNLGTVTIGAFSEEEIIKAFNLPPAHIPLYVMPVGWPNE